MIRSMTGFGQAETIVDGVRLSTEVKSVNHRYAETVFRIPREWGVYEDKLRRLVQQRIKRGRVEVFIAADYAADLPAGGGAANANVAVNWALADAYLAAARQLKARYGLSGELTLAQLLTLPEVVMSDRRLPADERWEEALLQCLDEALSRLDEMRLNEGRHLLRDLRERLETLRRLLSRAEAAAPEAAAQYRVKLQQKMEELLAERASEMDDTRLLMEVAIMAERTDIAEELTRFASHIKQFAELLEAAEPIGRRLDFLIQEMNREANTIGSKAGHGDLVAFAVDAKAELEKMREQVQNIE